MRKLKNKKVIINHLYWNVVSYDDEKMKPGIDGFCTPPFDKEIGILEKGGMEDIDTLIHEILHAIDFSVDAKLTEGQVHKMAHGLSFVLRDNPWLFNYIKQKIKEEYGNA